MRTCIARLSPAALLLIAVLIPAPVLAQAAGQPGAGQARVDDRDLLDERRIVEREQAARLRRARAEHEARRTEAALRREAELERESEIGRLQSDVLRSERRESFLRHESWQVQQALRAPPADPGDHAAIATRLDLDRQRLDQRHELQQTTTARDDAVRRLQQLRPR